MQGQMRWAECTYCGDGATQYDHVPPVSCLYSDPVLITAFRRRTSRVGDPAVVPACARCNITLGSKKLFSIHERAAKVSDFYSARYERVYASALWTEPEIQKLGSVLRLSVRAFEVKRQVLIEQIRHANLIKSCQWLEPSHIWSAYYTGVTLSDFIHEQLYGKKSSSI